MTTTHTPNALHALHTEPCKDDARAPGCVPLYSTHTHPTFLKGTPLFDRPHRTCPAPAREPTPVAPLSGTSAEAGVQFRASATAECESVHVIRGGCDGCTGSTIGIPIVVLYKLSSRLSRGSDGAGPAACTPLGVADGCVHVAATRTCSAAALASGPRGASCASVRDSIHRRLSGRCWIVEFLLWCVLALSPILRQ